MAIQVIMPKLSPTMEEGQLSRWLKKEGDKVSMGEPLAEIDTDKATMEMQALGDGVLRKILIKEGESAPLGQLIAIIGEPDEDISALEGSAAKSSAATGKPAEATAEVDAAPAPAPTAADQTPVAAVAEAVKGAGGKTQPDTGAESRGSAAGNGSQAAKSGATSSGRLIVSPLAARMAAEA